jgi:hypothetical protein
LFIDCPTIGTWFLNNRNFKLFLTNTNVTSRSLNTSWSIFFEQLVNTFVKWYRKCTISEFFYFDLWCLECFWYVYTWYHYYGFFYMPVSRRSVLCDWVWRAGGRPHRFPPNNFSSVYQIFIKLGHMIPLWKGKDPIYFRVIRSKVKVTVTINRIFDNMVVSAR